MGDVKSEMLVLKQRIGESEEAFEARVTAAGITAADNTVIYIVPVEGRTALPSRATSETAAAQIA